MLEAEVKECERVRRLWKLFSLEVEHKLGQEALRGKTGWDTVDDAELADAMVYNAKARQLIDTTAYAFFLYCRENFKNEMRVK